MLMARFMLSFELIILNRMIRIVTVALVFLVTTVMAQVDAVPEWYNKPPVSARRFYAAGTAVASTLELAEKKAAMDAEIQLARQVGQVKYHSTNGKNTTTEVVKAELRDVRIERKKVISNGNTHTVYVLVSMKKKRST